MENIEMQDIVEEWNLAIDTDDSGQFILCGLEKCKENKCRSECDTHK